MWGAGSLGSCAVAILRALYPSVEIAVVARFDAQADLVRKFGAHHVIRLDGQTQLELVEDLAEWSGGQLVPTMEGLGGVPMCHPGFIDVAYDTIAKPETFEVEVRVLKARGTLVKSGVHAPGRWEWSPLYFKEITWVGSNAFGIEEVEGVRKHGIEHYIDLVSDGTHRPDWACSRTRSVCRSGRRRSSPSPTKRTRARSKSPSTQVGNDDSSPRTADRRRDHGRDDIGEDEADRRGALQSSSRSTSRRRTTSTGRAKRGMVIVPGPELSRHRGDGARRQRRDHVVERDRRACVPRSGSRSRSLRSSRCTRTTDSRTALAKRGITDLEKVQIDPWPTGNFGIPHRRRPTRRALHLVSTARTRPTTATRRPIEGLVAWVDMGARRSARHRTTTAWCRCPPIPAATTPSTTSRTATT